MARGYQWFKAVLTSSLFLSSTVGADTQQTLPRWELGAGLSFFDFPHYPGSDQRDNITVPFPYIVYRGDNFEVNGGAIRGFLLEDDRFSLDVSLSGSLQVQSEDNDARAGMPDLDYTVELGPSLEYYVGNFWDKQVRVDINLPVRALLSTDFSDLEYQGWIIAPSIQATIRPEPSLSLGLRATVGYADDGYQNYFYGVPTAFATASRPAYDAEGGYNGLTLSASVRKSFGDYSVGVFLSNGSLSGSSFEDSPLVRTTSGIAAGFVVFVDLFESEERVPVRRASDLEATN